MAQELLFVRHGPPPADTEDEDGNINADFTGCFTVPISEDERDTLYDDDNAFHDTVRSLWHKITSAGDGHMLVGICQGFRYTVPASHSCLVGPQTNVVPSGYRRLCAVLQGPPGIPDLVLDYRGDETGHFFLEKKAQPAADSCGS